MAIDPIFTYVGGIAFLVLIIGTMLYLTFSTQNVEDDNPGESVVKGVGADGEPVEEDETAEIEDENEAAADDAAGEEGGEEDAEAAEDAAGDDADDEDTDGKNEDEASG
jgi:hypothetical protein